MPTTSNQIASFDYNNIRSKAVALLGPGSASRGYGQSIYSTPVLAGNQVTADQWNALRADIVNIRIHQSGLTPAIPSPQRGDVIRAGAGHPYTSYDTALDQSDSTRFDLATTQSVLTPKVNKTTTSTWSTEASATLTVSFATADQARWFFNSGGKVKIRGEIVGGSGRQTEYWRTLLSAIGNVDFGAAAGSTPYYSLTSSYQLVYQSSNSVYASVAYSSNYFRIEAKVDVANNSLGTAKELTFRIIMKDVYVDSAPLTPPYDQVDGTLNIYVSELKAAGSMQPSGAFSIVSPNYSLTSITVS